MISNPKFCPQCGTALEMREDGERNRPVCPACGFVYYLNPIVAAGALIEQGERVALVQRGVEPGSGLWGLPAGYVEADESAEEAAVRETWEEAHLQIEVEGLLDAFSFGSDVDRGVLLVYGANVVSGQLQAGDDATDARWFGPNELPQIAFRTHREVLRKWRRARAVVYRPATLSEAEVVTMLAEVYSLEQRCSYAALAEEPDRELFAAVDQGQVVGFSGVSLSRQGAIAEICEVFVHPRYRRWGIGTELIRACVRWGREMNVRAVQVETPVSVSGWTVYLKAGFHISGFSNDHYYGRPSEEPQTVLFLTCSTAESTTFPILTDC